MQHSIFTQTFEQLPQTLPIFPLTNAIAMPGSYLPLNIFEQRYLNMVRDAMRGEQLIGMIQPLESEKPMLLHKVGTCGRIVQYEETTDGRLHILLSGLCRFKIKQELDAIRGYRIVSPDWSPFANDFETYASDDTESVSKLRYLLKGHIDQNNYDPKWKSIVDSTPMEQLINNAINYLAISSQDKQLLIEADTLNERITALIAILQTVESDTIQH